MAPTEILAEQHYRSLAPLLTPLGISCALLTASTLSLIHIFAIDTAKYRISSIA